MEVTAAIGRRDSGGWASALLTRVDVSHVLRVLAEQLSLGTQSAAVSWLAVTVMQDVLDTCQQVDYTPTPRGADLARQIAHGQWRIVGHTRLRGQPAIKLAQTRSGTFQGHPVFLWVSTASYLPLRMI